MTPYERASREAARRVEVMPAEIGDWVAAAEDNLNGLGIHSSQLAAVKQLLEILVKKQRDALEGRPAAGATTDYAEAELELTAELVGAHELWNAFRTAFEQRRQPNLVRALDGADLVAASAYTLAMDRAAEWEVVQKGDRRAPPLVCTEALDSPVTVARGKQFSGLTSTIVRYREKLLPIPLVLFPADRLENIWTQSTLMHEVGHDLDAELSFASEAIKAALKKVPAASRDQWQAWGDEIVADAVGVALGGAGFAVTLADWLLSVALAKQYAAPADSPHPPPHVRVRLLAALLDASGIALWQPIAASLLADIEAVPAPAWQAPFAAQAAKIAQAVMTTSLTALNDHAIRDLDKDLEVNAARTAELGEYFRVPFVQPPPGGPPPFPTRLVPSAAALTARSAATVEKLANIAENALDYIHLIPRPEFLEGPPPGQLDYLRKLAEDLDVRQPVTS